MATFETESVRIPGGELRVDLWGRGGPRVLLLHGIPGWRGTWRGVAERLAEGCRPIAPDLLGFGESSPAPPLAHAREQAAALRSMLDALGVSGGVHVVGFDFGGPTAVHLAAADPRVRSVVLAATNVFPDTPVPAPLRIAHIPVLGDLAFRALLGRPGLAGMWLAAVADRRAFPFSRYREALGSSRGVASTRRVFLESLRDLPGLYGPVARALGALGRPGAVLWGDRDPFFPVSVAERTAAALRAPLHLLPGCGHFVPEERPGEVASLVAEAIERAGTADREERREGPRRSGTSAPVSA